MLNAIPLVLLLLMPLHLVQLTDTHLLAEPDGVMLGIPLRDSLRRVVEAIQHDGAPLPDRVLVTGDLSQDGTPASYAAVGQLLAPLGVPCHGLPGNHDAGPALRNALNQPPFRPDCVVEASGWRVVLLDSTVPGAVHGAFPDAALDALDATLSAQPDTPTLLALHHGPFPVGAAWLDPINLRDPDGFRQVITDHPHVRLVLFGHIHQDAGAQWGDTHLLSGPSTGFQFAPQADTFAVDDVPPGYRRVTLYADGTFETTLHRVPVPFTPDPQATGY
jgi:Icc protein